MNEILFTVKMFIIIEFKYTFFIESTNCAKKSIKTGFLFWLCQKLKHFLFIQNFKFSAKQLYKQEFYGSVIFTQDTDL